MRGLAVAVVLAGVAVAVAVSWSGVGPLGAALSERGAPPIGRAGAPPRSLSAPTDGASQGALASSSGAGARLARVRVRRGEWRMLWSQRARDWVTAAGFVGRFVFPGTRWWLLVCSRSEGGSGPFVLNRQGSGAGGWLQIMPGSWAAWVGSAHRDARRRGFVVPLRHMRWRDPLGQAVVGAWAFTNGLRDHWAGSGC